MRIRTLMTLFVLCLGMLKTGTSQTGNDSNMNMVRVRYMVNNVGNSSGGSIAAVVSV